MIDVSVFASADGGSGGAALIQLLILLMIPLAMYFLMIRPQRRRMRETQQLQKSLEVGDEVVTTSGIYGVISGEDGDKFWLEIDDDVQIRIARAAVAGRAGQDTRASTTDADDAKIDGS